MRIESRQEHIIMLAGTVAVTLIAVTLIALAVISLRNPGFLGWSISQAKNIVATQTILLVGGISVAAYIIDSWQIRGYRL